MIFESCKERLRPELITMLMKTLGLLPMVLSRDESASMWKTLGLTVLCGTITGTLLTMLIIPTAYYVLERPKESLRNFFRSTGILFLYNFIMKTNKVKNLKENNI